MCRTSILTIRRPSYILGESILVKGEGSGEAGGSGGGDAIALYTLNARKLMMEVAPAKGHTVHGGQVAVAAMCRKVGLWSRHLELVRKTLPRWSISRNRRTEPLERVAAEQPASARTAYEENHYACVRHRPEGCEGPQVYAVRRRRGKDELFDRHACRTCEDDARAPKSARDRHDLKGERERMFSQLLTDLDPHHPPCLSLKANRAFYTLAAIAYNVLTALKLLELPAEHHAWRVRTLIRHLPPLAAKLSRHARGLVLRRCCSAGWLNWWRLWREHACPTA